LLLTFPECQPGAVPPGRNRRLGAPLDLRAWLRRPA
jgi:hypothetical protein